MITRTEDNLDVDYDIFSLAGRAALVGGGIYAINRSIEQGVFKKGKESLLNKRTNKYTQKLADVISPDIKKQPVSNKTNYSFKDSQFFNFDEDAYDPNSQKRLSSTYGKINFGKGKTKVLQDFLNGGFKGQSKDLFNELVRLQDTVVAADYSDEFKGLKSNKTSGQIRLNFGDNGTLSNITIHSKAGNLTIHPVDKEGFVTMGARGQNRYVSKAFYKNDGHKIGSIYGSDVGLTRYLADNYEKILRGDISLQEIKHKYMQSLQYDDKNFNLADAKRMNPATVDMVRTSAMPDPYRPIGKNAQKTIMRHAAVRGLAFSGASDITKGIINLEGNPIETIPFLKETSNPKQLIRSNVGYVDSDGKGGFLSQENTLFMDEEDLKLLRNELSARDINLGELAKEELLINSNRAGYLVDNTRSLEINTKKLSGASEFLLNKMSSVAGLSPEEFSLKIKQGGFEAFDSGTRQKLKAIGLKDYHNYLKRELDLSFIKRKALMAANKGVMSWGSNPDEIAAFREAELLRDQGKLKDTLKQTRKEITTRVQEYRNQNILGMSKDGSGVVKMKKVHNDLLMDDLHYSGNSLTFQFRRIKKLGQGDKIHDPSGEVKAIIKGSIPDLPKILEKIYKRKNRTKEVPNHIRERFLNTTFIANKSAMKSTIDSRNAYSMFHAIKEENKLRPNQAITKVLDEFNRNYLSMTDEERVGIFNKLDEIVSGDFQSVAGLDTGVGFSKNKLIAFGNAAQDMGAGGLGFFSERHINLFTAMGASSFAKEIISRRENQGTISLYNDVMKTQSLLNDTKYSGFIDFDKLNSQDFLDNVFPKYLDEGESVFDIRSKYLAKYTKNGAAMVSLGEEIGGYRNIPIFNSEALQGYIGNKIGSSSDYKKYAELDSLTEQIIREVKKPNKSRAKLETLIKDYDVAIKQMTGSLRDDLFKGKVRNSLYGQVSSAGQGLGDYADRLARKFKTKNAQSFVVAVNDNKFIEMFGEEALEQFKKTGLSNYWAMATREPVEGLSSIPVNVVPSSGFKDIEHLDDTRISLIDGIKNNIMKMLFGDMDGDSLSLIAASGEKAAQELQELAYGNSDRSIAFRKHQENKTKFSLKGKESKRLVDEALSKIRESTYLAKDLEKGFVGVVSNALKPIREANALLNINEGNIDKYYNIENTLHTFIENIIKGKHQSTEDLLSNRGARLLDAITANGDFAKASVTDRIKYFREFTDELFLGPAAKFGDRIRSGERSQELITEIADSLAGGKEGALEDAFKRANEMLDDTSFTDLTSNQAMQDLMEVSDLSKKGVSPMDDALELAKEEAENALSSQGKSSKVLLEQIKENAQEAKKMMNGLGGNIAKYALLPAAAFGFLGTIFGAKSSISSEAEFSDGQKKHDNTQARIFKPLGSDNMRQQKYMKPEISGQARSGFNIDRYASGHGTGEVRYTDHTRNFDYFDMQDKITRGY